MNSDISGNKKVWQIDAALSGRRLDAALCVLMPDLSRSFIQRLIESGNVTDGTAVLSKAGRKVKEGEFVAVVIPEPESPGIEPENIPLDILYEDEDVIVINKPKGMVVHPAPGHYTGTLVNALMYHCKDSLSGINGELRPGIVHRIDRYTTGSLVAAKNDLAHNSLAQQLKDHTITRRYRAIVSGNLPRDEGVIDAPVGRSRTDRKKMAVYENAPVFDDADYDPVNEDEPKTQKIRRAVTHYKVLERFGHFTYVECRLETGRTHQIRVHMAHIGHPVLGDMVYGPQKCPYRLEGQTLHAMVLGFVHPRTGAYMEFTAPLPDYFVHLLELLRKS